MTGRKKEGEEAEETRFFLGSSKGLQAKQMNKVGNLPP